MTTPIAAKTVFYADVRDDLNASAASKEKQALNHFNHFLKDYCGQIGIDVVEAASIPYRGIPRKPSNKAVLEFWDLMIGAFITYMGNHARIGCDPEAERLKRGTAAQYCSSVKGFFVNKFRNDPAIPVFQDKQWSKLMTKLRGKYREANRAVGKPAVEGNESSTREDREWMATGCIWDGTAETAEFWHLLNTSYHCSGRCSEVSLVKPEDIRALEVNDVINQYDILQSDVQRQKDGPLQSIAIYPHRDGVLEDYYFSLIYLIVMAGCNNRFMLPTFSTAASKTKSGKSNSQVSSLWSALFDDIRNKFESLSTKINSNLSSHCNRGGSNQVVVETPGLSLAAVFRTGWANRGRDTLWEYISDSFVLSSQAGKALSRWTCKIGDVIHGGQPPSFDDIGGYQGTPPPSPSQDSDAVATALVDGNRDKLQQFADVLFEDDVEQRWHPKVREILVMALLLRYDQFCAVLRKHPGAYIPDLNFKSYDPSDPRFDVNHSLDYNTIRDHLFVCRVKQALKKAGADELVFNDWCKCARSAFIERNLISIPDLSLYGGTNKRIKMDPRCFIDHFNALSSLAQSTHHVVQQLRRQLNDMTEIMTHNLNLNHQHHFTQSALVDSVRRIESHLLGDRPQSVSSQPSSSVITKFTVSSKGITNRMSVSDVFVSFFYEDYRAGFELDKNSEAWKEDMDATEKKKHKNLFAKIKRAIRMVLMHADDFPLPPDDPSKYKEVLRRTTSAAEDRIRNSLAFGEKKISFYTLTNLLEGVYVLP